MRFYRWTLRIIRENPTFFQYIFNDKILFHRNKQLNIIVIIYRHNRYNCPLILKQLHWTQRIDNQFNLL